MGLSSDHGLGRNRKFFAAKEVTAGTFVKPVSAAAGKVLKFGVDYKQERRDRRDSRAHRSIVERITGRKSIPWSLESYIIPSGSLGVAPDLGVLYEAAFGVETVNASTNVIYSGNSSQQMPTLSMYHHYNDAWAESLWGAWVESVTIRGSGGEDPRIAFEGAAQGYQHTAPTVLDGALAAAANPSVDDDAAIGINSLLAFWDASTEASEDDNSGAGFLVTAGTASPFTIDANATVDDNDLVRPFAPSETTTGVVTSGIAGSFTLASGTFIPTAYEVRLANTFKPVDDEAFQSAPTDAIPGMREVTGSITGRARRDHMLEMAKRGDFTARDIALVIGSTSGSILTIDMDQVEFEFSKVDIPEEDEGVLTLPFKALGSSGNDEITLTFT